MESFLAMKFFSGNKEIMKSPMKQLSTLWWSVERKKCQVCAALLALSLGGSTQSCCISTSLLSSANLWTPPQQDSCHCSTTFSILGSQEPLKVQCSLWGESLSCPAMVKAPGKSWIQITQITFRDWSCHTMGPDGMVCTSHIRHALGDRFWSIGTIPHPSAQKSKS